MEPFLRNLIGFDLDRGNKVHESLVRRLSEMSLIESLSNGHQRSRHQLGWVILNESDRVFEQFLIDLVLCVFIFNFDFRGSFPSLKALTWTCPFLLI